MSAAEPVTLLARWQTQPGSADQVLALAAELRRGSLTEPGCLGYEVFRSAEEPGTLLLLERYRDAAAIDAHRQSAHYRELVVGRILPLLAARQIELLRPRDAA
jgi:quinol monooxygenase YgiN